MIDRAELDRWLREHDYALITREQARIFDGPGVVPWDEHRRALTKVEAELATTRARVAALEAVVEVSRIAVSSAWGHTDRAALADALAQLASAAETGSGEADEQEYDPVRECVRADPSACIFHGPVVRARAQDPRR